MIRCEYCDSQLDDNSKFCPNCGAKLTAKSKVGFNTNNNTNTTNNTNSNIKNTTTKGPLIKGFGLGFIITFLVTLIGVGFMGVIALVLVIAFGDDKARKGAIFGFLAPLIIVLLIFTLAFVLSVALGFSAMYIGM